MIPKTTFESLLNLEAIDENGRFEGYASVFDHQDSAKDRVQAGAFSESLKRAKSKGVMPALLWQHDANEPIGIWREIFEDSHGLFVRGELFVNDIPRARQAYALIKERAMTGLSIGFKAQESYRDVENGVRVLTKIDLFEISLVTFPALDTARVSHVKTALKKTLRAGKIPDARSVETVLREAGFSRKQAKGFIAAGLKSLTLRDAERQDIEGNESHQMIKTLTQRLWRLTHDNLTTKRIS